VKPRQNETQNKYKHQHSMNNLVIKTTSLALCGSILFSSCAATGDGRRTQAEGAGAGAAIGLIAGHLFGVDPTALAVVGGLAGFAYGTNVAKKKASYAKQEDFLDYAVAQAQQTNQQAVSKNQTLLAEVESLEKKYGNVADASAKKKGASTANKQMVSIDKQVKTFDAQIADYRECLNGPGYGDKSQSSALRGQIKTLEGEKAKLIKTKTRLAAAQSRLAV
jgi:hypothetical protein